MIFTLLVLLSAAGAQAREDGALSLSPAVVMLSGHYGQSTTQTLTLRNGTSRTFSFDLVAQDVVMVGGKRSFVEAGSISGSIAATAVFSPRQVEIAPGGTASVTMTVTLPPATRQRAIVALFRGTNRIMSGNTPMTASLGSLLTFSLSKQLEMSATALAVQPQSATSNLTVRHSCTNSGDEPFVTKGVLAVIDQNGALVGRSTFESTRLLPGETSELSGEYPGELEPGRYRVFVNYDYEGKTLSRSAEVEIR